VPLKLCDEASSIQVCPVNSTNSSSVPDSALSTAEISTNKADKCARPHRACIIVREKSSNRYETYISILESENRRMEAAEGWGFTLNRTVSTGLTHKTVI
jgi:hypothetical protein